MNERAFPDLLAESMRLSYDYARAVYAPFVPFSRPDFPKPRCAADCCCEVPERPCPPHCAAHIEWKGLPGHEMSATIRLRNVGEQRRTFSFAATPFTASATNAIAISPLAVTLEPGSEGLATAEFSVPVSFGLGNYAAEVSVSGLYTQFVCVELQVGCHPEQRHATARLAQGEIPTRIRAHRWYDHFVCEEICFNDRSAPGTSH